MTRFFLLFVFLLCVFSVFSQNTHTLKIDTKNEIAEVSPTMWGVFFEDINFAADGGIYAELVKNRSFEFRNPLQGWKVKGLSLDKGELLIISENKENNPTFLRLNLLGDKTVQSLENEGFRGMGIKKGETYNFYIMAQCGNPAIKIWAELIGGEDKVIGRSDLIGGIGTNWKEYHAKIVANDTEPGAKLVVHFEGSGLLEVDMISLFPQNTWKNRPKGFRADLIQLLADLKPGFVRFPGGCIVEGYDLQNRYQWKNTVGPIENRVLIKSRWMDEFRHRLAPDYYQSFGIGFYEYFQLSEDLNAEPLPIVNCGMACQYNSKELAPMNELGPYIQDALDLIEFANGDTNSTWGKVRAEMGHPEPFNLKYLGIGNEQWGPQYVERYIEFHEVLREKHPEIVIIAASGPTPDDRNKYLWEELTKLKTDIIDEHYYKDPNWFYSNATRYDSFDRNGPKVFAGEYASHTKAGEAPESRNNWEAALSEAAFMTGLERNADVVVMTSYAPLFANKNAWQWNPDLIWFDNLNAIPTPNYLVQQVFSLNKGDKVVTITENDQPLTGQDKLYSSATIDDVSKTILVKLVNASGESQMADISVEGSRIKQGSTVVIETLTGTPELFNEVGGKNNFEKKIKELTYRSSIKNIELDPLSVNVLKIKMK